MRIKDLLVSPDEQAFELGLALLKARAGCRDTYDILQIIRRLTKDTKYYFMVYGDIFRHEDIFYQFGQHKVTTPLMNMLNSNRNDNIKVDADEWRWSIAGSCDKNNSESL